MCWKSHGRNRYCDYLSNAKTIAIFDIVLNCSSLVCFLLLRPTMGGPSILAQMFLWNLLLIFNDLVLIYGLSTLKLACVAFWKAILFFKIIVNCCFLLLLAIFALPKMELYLDKIQNQQDGSKAREVIRYFTFLTFAVMVLLVPFDGYFLYSVNKTVSGMVSWIPNSNDFLMSDILRDRSSSNPALFNYPKQFHQLEVPHSWIHQDMIFSAPRPHSSVLIPSQPNGMTNDGPHGFEDPMKPFMPMYSPHPALRYSANMNQVSPLRNNQMLQVWQG